MKACSAFHEEVCYSIADLAPIMKRSIFSMTVRTILSAIIPEPADWMIQQTILYINAIKLTPLSNQKYANNRSVYHGETYSQDSYAFTHPSFSQLFVICAHRPQTTLPPAVTKPSSLTLTSIIVPFVRTPNCVYIGFCGFFLTLIIGS